MPDSTPAKQTRMSGNPTAGNVWVPDSADAAGHCRPDMVRRKFGHGPSGRTIAGIGGPVGGTEGGVSGRRAPWLAGRETLHPDRTTSIPTQSRRISHNRPDTPQLRLPSDQTTYQVCISSEFPILEN